MLNNSENINGEITENYIGSNLRLLRSRLELTQKEFIENFLTDKNGKKIITISKLSMIENGDMANLNEILGIFCENYRMDATYFSLPTEQFVQHLAKHSENQSESLEIGGTISAAPPKRSSYVEDLVKFLSDYLTENMINGKLHPGDKIPSEREMVKLFKVSRSALREAIKVLSTIGLLDVRPGQGTFISSKDRDFFESSLSWSLLVGEKTSEDILELRMILECESAYNASIRGTESNFAELKSILHKMEVSVKNMDIDEFLNLDMDFHLAIAKSTQNQVIYRLFSTIRRIMRHYSQTGMATVKDIEDIYKEHAEIVSSIINGNTDFARDSMRTHIIKSNARYNNQTV